VVNVESGEPFDVYVGRETPWGNPFRTSATVGRTQAIAAFRAMLRATPGLAERARRELRGKVLGCHCRPKACHADCLAEVANAED
jgi:Domain of unknown function (DUF4326)